MSIVLAETTNSGANFKTTTATTVIQDKIQAWPFSPSYSSLSLSSFSPLNITTKKPFNITSTKTIMNKTKPLVMLKDKNIINSTKLPSRIQQNSLFPVPYMTLKTNNKNNETTTDPLIDRLFRNGRETHDAFIRRIILAAAAKAKANLEQQKLPNQIFYGSKDQNSQQTMAIKQALKLPSRPSTSPNHPHRIQYKQSNKTTTISTTTTTTNTKNINKS
ncbi:hypothetical protein HUG17_0253 [Dermatophagoides farinae]|uniref:Uncharacterized protein n=1 Tax=Dermatophagoides farinae TaxID=6954 RepID=A0A9D4P4Q1_DERFA|nr:hypothetical protein HUG17_0253 [Dermatophagoides farinae]